MFQKLEEKLCNQKKNLIKRKNDEISKKLQESKERGREVHIKSLLLTPGEVFL